MSALKPNPTPLALAYDDEDARLERKERMVMRQEVLKANGEILNELAKIQRSLAPIRAEQRKHNWGSARWQELEDKALEGLEKMAVLHSKSEGFLRSLNEMAKYDINGQRIAE